MNGFNQNPKGFPKVILVVAHLLTFNFLSINPVVSQCDPSTIDPCNIGKNSIIQASYHAQIIKTSNGYAITGQNFAPSGNDHQDVLANIPSSNYPMPTGIFPVWGAIGGRTQAVFVGSDSRIYAVGSEDLLLHNANTSGTAWGPTNGNATGERDGFLAFSTIAGDLYVTGRAASYVQFQAANADWTKIDLPIGIGVVDFAVGHQTLLVLGNDGNFYAAGSATYFGNGTSADLNSLTLLAIQPPISIAGITQIEAGYRSYLVLDGDGTIHVLGENSEGSLGVGHTDDVMQWTKVGDGCEDGPLMDVAYISTLSSQDNRSASSAILVNRTIRSWGNNNRQSIDSGVDRLITCPIAPNGNNNNAVAISNGGHISPYVNIGVQICNIGHNRQGAFGDGNSDGGDYGLYTCIDIPGTPEICGTKKADLELLKTVNDFNPAVNDTIIFTITVTNKGLDASTGSTVRDQLTDGFDYLSDDANGAYNPSTGLWTVGPIAVGDSTSLNLRVIVLTAGENVNYAQVVSDNEVDGDSIPGDDSTDQDDDDTISIVVDPIPECTDITISLDVNGNGSARVEDIFISDIIDCRHVDSLTIDYDAPLSFDCSDLGTTEITFNVMDQCRNASTCTSTITVQAYRATEEVLLCPEDSIFLDNNWIYEPSVHIDTFTNAFGCDSLHITNVKYVPNPPVPQVNVDCAEQEVVLNIAPQAIWHPTWDNGDTTHETIYEPNTPQANLILNAAPNCEEQLTITLPPLPNLNDVPALQDITIQENTPLAIPLNLNMEEWQMNWTPPSIVNDDSSGLINIATTESAKVTMSLAHISGCTYESSFLLRVTLAPENFYIPNVFSPNGDNRNDEWTVFHSPNIQITSCEIFNRWGTVVYRSTTHEPTWNGQANGAACVPGVYVYVLTYSNTSGESKVKSGDLTLVK